MVRAGERQAEHAPAEGGGDARRAGRADVQQLVAALGERVDDRGDAGDADPQAGVERDLDLGHRRQPAVDMGVGSDHVDLEAGHAALPDLVERVSHAVHRADAVGDERDPDRLGSARREPALLAAEERGRRGVRDRGDAGLEDREPGAHELALRAAAVLVAVDERVDRRGLGRERGRRADHPADRRLELALVAAAGAPVEVGVREAVGLQVGDQVAVRQVQLDRREPGAQQRAGVFGAEVGGRAAATGVGVGHHPLDHLEDGGRVGLGAVLRAATERADGKRHRVVRPARRAALVAARLHAAGADVREELLRRGGPRSLGERAADVDPGVVVGPADPGPPVRLDVDRGREVELGVARAVAHLPDPEQLGEPAPVAWRERRGDGVERVRERAGDLAFVQVRRDDLDVVAVRLQPLVVVGRDAEAQHVHLLRLAAERDGELLGHEHAGAVGDRQRAVDRVVVGDRDEVHAAPLGERVDLFRRRGALGQPERGLDPEPGDRGRGRVAVQVDPAGRAVRIRHRTCRFDQVCRHFVMFR